MTEKVREFLASYRVWPQADTILESELTALVDDYEQVEEWLAALAGENRLHEGSDDLSDQQATQAAVERYVTLRNVLEDQMVVDVEGSDNLKGDLLAYITQKDELEVFRSLILGAVKSAGALASEAFPDDNRLVILVKALFP